MDIITHQKAGLGTHTDTQLAFGFLFLGKIHNAPVAAYITPSLQERIWDVASG